MHQTRLTRSSSPSPATGIVHLGLGAFYRAFGAVFIADAVAKSGGDWGIVGVSLKSSGTRDALAPQGWSYSSVTLTPDAENVRTIEILNDVLVAPENPEVVLSNMVNPNVKIVSLTVTEKGYCHNPATGSLNADHPDIIHDLAHLLPRSAIGFLVRALQKRMEAGHRPFTVLTCDNLPENGKLVRGVVLEFARRLDPDLADWISREARFPATMVDRITPATTADDILRVSKNIGYYDAAPVMHEDFAQWAVEDDFVDSLRPDLSSVGVEMVSDVTAHEHMKLRMLNGTHSALAYVGYLSGYETISDTISDPDLAAYAQKLWTEIIPTVKAPAGADLSDYAQDLFKRYANPRIQHRTWQIAMDGSQKLPQRILGTLRNNLEAGNESPGLCLAVVAWMRYVSGTDENGQPIDVKDPLCAHLQALSKPCKSPSDLVAALLSVDQIFPTDLAKDLHHPLCNSAERLWSLGAHAAAKELSS